MQQPFFLNNGGNKNTKPGLYLWYDMNNPFIERISTEGELSVYSTVNGKEHVEKYNQLDETVLYIQADPNTQVRIEGSILLVIFRLEKRIIMLGNIDIQTVLCQLMANADLCDFSGANITMFQIQSVKNLNIYKIDNNIKAAAFLMCGIEPIIGSIKGAGEILLEGAYIDSDVIDFSYYNQLFSLSINYCDVKSVIFPPNIVDLTLTDTLIENVDLSNCPKITEANIGGELIKSLNISKNTELKSFNSNDSTLEGLKAITTIYALARNQNVATSIAAIITNANSTSGTVYLNSSDTYASTISEAATAKGWNVEELAA